MRMGCDKETGKLFQRHESAPKIGKALIAQEGLDPFHRGADRIKPQHDAPTALSMMLTIGFEEGAVVMGDAPIAGIEKQHFAQPKS